MTSLFSVIWVKLTDRAASMSAAGHGETEGEPEGPGGRVHAGGLADPLLLDGSERVVVELRHQQAQAAARDGERDHEVPAAVHPWDERDDDRDPDGGQQEAGADDRGGTPVTGPLAGDQGRREHGQRQGRQRQAGLERVVLEGHLEEQRQRDHRPAQGDLLQHLTRDPGGEVRVPEQVRVEQGHLPLALAPDQPPGEQPPAPRPRPP